MSDQPTELDRMMREGTPHGHGDEPAKKKHRRPHHKELNMQALNLTAMMDMMTIILVFLIKNFASSPENVQMDANLQPPRSTAKIKMEVAITITITKLGLAVDDKPILEFTGPSSFAIKGEPVNTSQPIAALQERLDTKVGDLKRLEEKGGPAFEGKILVVADEKTPYAFLMRVLYTAGVAQFSQYKLIVRSKADGPAKPGGH